ncbi:hypothetical protein [Methylobacterium sp. J-076]|uniref:hypothetical protein n=1 Tax=Methylobacterium sp. J-076 TaxID=2836655 RepID=UPI001FB98EC1|nr:hypothetical protein [Methylobacterium sp. J-076]MCJ2015576.1 hypothetical protein [Methylobacterium sp. J-076]
MSDDGTIVGNADQLADAIQSLIQRNLRSTAGAPRAPGTSQVDTTADQSDPVPGRDVAYGSFAKIQYFPSPINTSSPRDNPDGSRTFVKVMNAQVIGWTANRGSSYAEDTKTTVLGTDGFSGTFTGWSSQYQS